MMLPAPRRPADPSTSSTPPVLGPVEDIDAGIRWGFALAAWTAAVRLARDDRELDPPDPPDAVLAWTDRILDRTVGRAALEDRARRWAGFGGGTVFRAWFDSAAVQFGYLLGSAVLDLEHGPRDGIPEWTRDRYVESTALDGIPTIEVDALEDDYGRRCQPDDYPPGYSRGRYTATVTLSARGDPIPPLTLEHVDVSAWT